MANEVLIRLFDASRQPAVCRGCQARIDWFETLIGNKMPMNAGAVARSTTINMETGRTVGFFAADDSHWNTCPARAQFSRRARA